MEQFAKTTLNQVQRLPKRGEYDKKTVYDIVDEALICHVGFVADGQPFVMPTIHTRIGETIYLHGAIANRMMNHAKNDAPVCITMTLVDGIVFARSAFHHSMNYRSAVLFGKGRPLRDDEEKMSVLHALSDHIAKGRWNDARQPSQKELDGTQVVAVNIENASAKIRTGPPVDDEEDYDRSVWAGILPLTLQPGTPLADARLKENISVPDYIRNYKR